MNGNGKNEKGECGGERAKLVRIGERPAEAVARRDFLSLMGFSLAATGLSGCRAPVQKAIPLLVASDRVMAGNSLDYASTCGGCPSSCAILVKQRDGRPIKIEGNPQSPLFGGGTCAVGQATVLSLYDEGRLQGPRWKGTRASWEEVDRRVLDSLAAARAGDGSVVLLSGTITSPSTLRIVESSGERHPGFRHVVYDASSLTALRKASELSFGEATVPHYAFDAASVIVALGADFLGTWLSPVEFARQYADGRRRDPASRLHVQFESGLSLTGSNADLRIPVLPSQLGAVAVALLRRIALRAGGERLQGRDPLDPERLDAVANQLWANRGRSLVVSGAQDVDVQLVVNALNALLGNVGKTVDFGHPSLQSQGDDTAMAALVEDLGRGRVHTLLLYGVNPAYDYAEPARFLAGLDRVALSASFSDRLDETSSAVDAICPDHHFLEAWGDAEPVRRQFSLRQPLIAPLFDTRAAQETLLRWLGEEKPSYHSYLREFWRGEVFPRQKADAEFDSFWDHSLQLGVFTAPEGKGAPIPILRGGWQGAAQAIVGRAARATEARRPGEFELQLYESVALRDGRHAGNPWLQELPDPITQVTWGNFAAISPAAAARLQLSSGDVVTLEAGAARLDVPVLVQPGQHEGTLSIAVGYGRTQVGKAGQGVGANAFLLAALVEGLRRYSVPSVMLRKTGRREELACTQGHFSMEGRPIALETTGPELREAEHSGAEPEGEPLPTLWAARPRGEHSWGMVIDLDGCTGCSACVVACQAENNVPVVGKDQIQRQRAMHWIRIDHYYQEPADPPRSLHQPMMCQHCGNAPCETVCPVLATTTSSEGLNQQIYNRCIGTRYCANNCPYKVRRFNWYNYTGDAAFDFNMANPLGRMVLNPDVTVRSRGVMEKCSLCVQRIQLGKNEALRKKRPLADGDIRTACEEACPTRAIVFGDLSDSQSRVSRLRQDHRYYRVLEELGTRPNVGYLKKIRTWGGGT